MPICRQCGVEFPNWWKLEGKRRNISKRKFCLSCSPFGRHNTKANNPKSREKLCRRCGEIDPDKFYKNKKILCIACDNIRSVEKQKEMKKRIVEYLGGKCSICGYNKCLRSLHLHHSKGGKDVNFSHIKNWGWERVLVEIVKCELVCSNCHGEIHDEASRYGVVVA